MATVLHPHADFEQVMVKHPSGFEVILVRHDGVVHAYRNSCPHIGVGLDWGDGQCLRAPNELICAMHGAIFTAESGECIAGPCFGKFLARIPVRIDNGQVICDGP